MKKILAIFLSVLWMGFIFYNSSMSGESSNEMSYKLLDNIKIQYRKIVNKENIKATEQLHTQDSKKIIEEPDAQSNTIAEEPEAQDQKVVDNTLMIKKKSNDFRSVEREQFLNKFLRKNAHAFEYLVLAILVSNLLFCFNMKGRRTIIYIMFACLFYAVIDEFHQSFVPNRTSLVSDVLIDFSGSLIGIGLYYLFYYKLGIKFNRENNKKNLLAKSNIK